MNKHSNTIPLRSQNSTKIDIKIKISTKIKIDTKIKINTKIKIDTKIIIKSTIKSKGTIHIMTNNTKMNNTDMNSLATSEIMAMSMVIRMDNKIIIRRFPSIKAGMFHTSHKVKAKSNIMVSSKPMHLQKNFARIRWDSNRIMVAADSLIQGVQEVDKIMKADKIMTDKK